MRFPGGWKGWIVLTAVTHLALAVWITEDAERRRVPAQPWASLTLVGGLFGVFGYVRGLSRRIG